MARVLEQQSIEELRLTTLQAIDHAYKSAAEIAEAWAIYEGAQGRILELEQENVELRETLSDLQRRFALISATIAWRAAQRAVRQARVVRRSLVP